MFGGGGRLLPVTQSAPIILLISIKQNIHYQGKGKCDVFQKIVRKSKTKWILSRLNKKDLRR